MSFARIDQSPVARWWWTIDRWTLLALAVLIGFGAVLTMAASPAVAERIGLDGMHFVRRQLALLPVAILLIFVTSLQSPKTIRRVAVIGFLLAVALVALTFVSGVEIKGARRWLNLPGLSLQPSEFVKPTFAVVTGWLLSEGKLRPKFPGPLIATGLYIIIVGLLVRQPDLGMAVVISAVWFAQFFLAGLRLYWVAVGLASGVVGLIGAYMFLPHVPSRIDRFLDPSSGDSYQVDR